MGLAGSGVRAEVSSAAAAFACGGRLWVWPARPRLCCSGTPALVHAATEPPADMTGLTPAASTVAEIWFRSPGGQEPDVLEIGLRGRRRPGVEAYWGGCLMAM